MNSQNKAISIIKKWHSTYS